MPKNPNAPTPPPGYSIANLPDFLKPANVGTKIASAPPRTDFGNLLQNEGAVDADVGSDNPTTINVRNPYAFTQPVQTHESTHVFQLSRNPNFIQQGLSLNAEANGTPAMYGYGGVNGLLKYQQQGKTIADFSLEQQAQMVADYQKATQDAIAKGDRVALARATAAYHPFVGQLANIPPAGANMAKMTQQDLTPPAPPVPPATVAGMPMLPDKLIGGPTAPPNGLKKVADLKSQAARLNPAATGRIIGQTKRFANGKTGVWDGTGWVAQPQ